MSIPRDEWEWYGSAAHLIVGRYCRFHLATKVGPWLVSTVGEYVHPMHSAGSEITERTWLEKNWPGEDIGIDRKYETMVFRIGGECSCGCGLPVPEDWDGVGFAGYNDAHAAREGHMVLCQEYANAGGHDVAD